MARTPLFSLVQRSLRLAAFASKSEGLPADEIVDRVLEGEMPGVSRRQFFRTAAAAGVVASTPDLFSAFGQTGGLKPRTAIVGAGIAGLNCAYKLRKAGVPVHVFEASSRSGGRMFTANNLLAPGITTELGGEFIDSGHEELLSLVKEFKLGMYDFRKPSKIKAEAFFFDGRHYSEKDVVKAFIPLARKIAKDYDSLGEEVSYRDHGNGKELDNTSIAEYLDKIGARGWVRELLHVAYVTEYGLEAEQQSSLNLIQMIGTDTSEGFKPFGDSDERFTVKGGNERVVVELANRLDQGIVSLRHRLTAISAKGKGYVLTFEGPNGTPFDRDFDTVVLTLPFTMLREVDIRVPLPAVKLKAIKELGYGTNAKVLAGFHARQWKNLGYRGNTLSDERFQLCWDNAALQPGTSSGITFYSGGKLGIEAGEGTAQEAVARLMPGLERAYPGSAKQHNGNVSRFHWPTHPFTKGSYAAYLPGQWTSIGGAEGESVGNLHFAGEHTSVDFQGYMNGGAQSGADAAKAVLASVSEKAARLFVRRSSARLWA
ncbi:MAG TPA: NAD(P)/FAD-dependent oxidoreductase [Thermoanaerobaculia bacterium]|nr:NAD(P)/FAD-dependent oxidoreductase [Thermoanaerobaculia bacterium]